MRLSGFYRKIVEIRVVNGRSVDIDWNKWGGVKGISRGHSWVLLLIVNDGHE